MATTAQHAAINLGSSLGLLLAVLMAFTMPYMAVMMAYESVIQPKVPEADLKLTNEIAGWVSFGLMLFFVCGCARKCLKHYEEAIAQSSDAANQKLAGYDLIGLLLESSYNAPTMLGLLSSSSSSPKCV